MRPKKVDVVVVGYGDVEKLNVVFNVVVADHGSVFRSGHLRKCVGRNDNLGVVSDKAVGHIVDHRRNDVKEGVGEEIETRFIESTLIGGTALSRRFGLDDDKHLHLVGRILWRSKCNGRHSKP